MSVCNCPLCLVGVVETVGYVELKEGPLEFKFGRFPLTKKRLSPSGCVVGNHVSI